MAYVQDHKLGLNMWQLSFFSKFFVGSGRNICWILGIKKRKYPGLDFSFALCSSLWSSLLYILSSPSHVWRWFAEVTCVALGLQLVLWVIFISGHRFPTLCIGSYYLASYYPAPTIMPLAIFWTLSNIFFMFLVIEISKSGLCFVIKTLAMFNILFPIGEWETCKYIYFRVKDNTLETHVWESGYCSFRILVIWQAQCQDLEKHWWGK